MRHGHISTLAYLVGAASPWRPAVPSSTPRWSTTRTSDAEREELLKEVADLASWDAVRHPDRVVRPKSDGGTGLTGTELLERARRRILDCNGGKSPKLLDPFAGGGAIPLEGLRLGLRGGGQRPEPSGRPDSQGNRGISTEVWATQQPTGSRLHTPSRR